MAKVKTLQDFNGDETAFKKYLEEQAAQSTPAATEEKPELIDITGAVSNISSEPITFRASGNKGRFLSIAGNPDQILIAEALFQNNKELLVKGMNITVVCEKRIKDVTGYVNQTKGHADFGKYVKHTASGLGFVRVELSEAQAKTFSALQDKKRELEVKNMSKVAAVSEIMNLQSTLLGDDTTAKGHAFSGAYAALAG